MAYTVQQVKLEDKKKKNKKSIQIHSLVRGEGQSCG